VSSWVEKLVDGQVDVFGDLPKQDRRNVSTLVKRNSGTPPIRMSELLMRTLLANFCEAMRAQELHDFSGGKYRDVAHGV